MFTILYIDDEPNLLEVGRLFLEQGGQFTVDTVTSAPAALELMNTKSYDAIISDYQMPVMDGIEFLKTVRGSGNTIPFILFTGRGREEIVIQALNEGADFYLQKGGEPMAQFTELAHQIRQAVLQRRAETSIRDLERREADIINFLPDATFAIDRSGRIIAWNHAIEEMTGVSAAEMLGKGDYEYAIPFYGQRQPILIDLIFEPDEVIRKKYAHIVHTKDVLIADTSLPRPRGKPLTLMGKASPLYNRQGGIIGAIESIRDITDMKKAEEALRESGERYRTLVESSFDGIAIHQDGRIVYVNRTAARVLGYDDPSRLAGMPVIDIVHPAFRTIAAERIRQATDSPQTLITEQFLRQDGTVVDVDVSATPCTWQGRPAVYVTFRDITGQVKAEESLRELSRRDREALHLARMGHFEFDVATQTFLFNDQYYAMIGTSAEREGGYRLTAAEFAERFVPPAYRHLVGEEIRAGLEATDPGFERRFESQILRPGGGTMWVNVWFRAEKDSFGRIVRFYGVNQDITDRKDAEKAIRERDNRYRLLLQSANDAILIHELTREKPGRMIEVNEKACSMLGYSREELLRMDIADIDVPEQRENVLKIQTTLFSEGNAVFRTEHLTKDRRRIPVEVSTRLIEFDGRPAALSIARDLSELKRKEQALEETREHYLELFEHANDGITIVQDGRISRVNKRFAGMLGYTAGELAGRSILEVIHPDDRELVMDRHQRRIAGEQDLPPVYTFRVMTRQGVPVWVELNTTLIDWHGRPATLNIIRDITGRKRAADALREMNRKLSLLSTVTRHDIRNKVTILSGYLALAKKKSDNPVMREFIDKLDEATTSISNHIEFTRIYQDLGNADPQWQDPGSILSSQKVPPGLTLENELPAIRILADPILPKVFFNLIDNTVRHGRHATTIRVSSAEQPDGLLIAWEDNGTGVPAGEKEKIFDQGYGKNTGLGLFLCREILAITGISIRETGVPKKGARFEILVPKGAFRYAGTGET